MKFVSVFDLAMEEKITALDREGCCAAEAHDIPYLIEMKTI